MTRRDLLAALAAAPVALGQAARDEATFRSEVNVVNVVAAVRDKQGKVIHDLTKEDFTLLEDGKPQDIRYFSPQSATPLNLGLLIDTSGSQVRVLASERRASYQFLRQVMREDLDKAFVIHFDFESELLQDVTSSKSDLETALSDVQSPEPRTVRMGGQGRGRGPGQIGRAHV